MESANTQSAASTHLILDSPFSFRRFSKPELRVKRAGLYLGIAETFFRECRTERALADFVIQLIAAADQAQHDRKFEVIDFVSDVLSRLPCARPDESVRDFYRALSLNRGGFGDRAVARPIFMQVAEYGPLRYRAKAMLALGSGSYRIEDHQTAMYFFREATRILTCEAFDPVMLCGASRMAAVIKAANGDHQGAMSDLEKMQPLARVAGSLQPSAYYDYLNAMAVELCEVGKLDEARHASEIALASPHAGAYPEWHETFDEIRSKQQRASRSIISVPQRINESTRPYSTAGWPATVESVDQARNRLRLPRVAANPSSGAGTSESTAARVLSFEQWKTFSKSASDPLASAALPQPRERMTTGEKLIRLMDLVSREETDDETIDMILEAVEEIVLGGPQQD